MLKKLYLRLVLFLRSTSPAENPKIKKLKPELKVEKKLPLLLKGKNITKRLKTIARKTQSDM